jgi:hypothetical protein
MQQFNSNIGTACFVRSAKEKLNSNRGKMFSVRSVRRSYKERVSGDNSAEFSEVESE